MIGVMKPFTSPPRFTTIQSIPEACAQRQQRAAALPPDCHHDSDDDESQAAEAQVLFHGFGDDRQLHGEQRAKRKSETLLGKSLRRYDLDQLGE